MTDLPSEHLLTILPLGRLSKQLSTFPQNDFMTTQRHHLRIR